jgi:hypothetical protein
VPTTESRTLGGPLLLVVVILLAVGVLCWSIYRFWQESQASRTKVRSARQLAALSSGLTLVVFVLLYADAFTRNLLAAMRNWGVSSDTYATVHTSMTSFDEFVAHVASTINVFSRSAGYRSSATLWPGLLLASAYAARFCIYRFQTKPIHGGKKNQNSALTGSVYWSHITAYMMVVAFMIVIIGWSAWWVVPTSLIVLSAFMFSVAWTVVKDLGVVADAVVLKSVGTALIVAGRQVAFLATEVANFIRIALKYANRAYQERISKPLREKMDALKTSNDSWRNASEERLKEQDKRIGKFE